MVEELGELDEGHLGVWTSHIHDPAAEGFTEGVRAEVLCFQMLDGLDLFKMAVHHLRGQDRSVFASEAWLRRINISKGPPAVMDVLLERFVDRYLPALPCLLLNQCEHTIFG